MAKILIAYYSFEGNQVLGTLDLASAKAHPEETEEKLKNFFNTAMKRQ